MHANAIYGAMKLTWGNSASLKIHSSGAKGDKLFVAEFGFEQDMEQALEVGGLAMGGWETCSDTV